MPHAMPQPESSAGPPVRLVLAGFMGSGKTTVGRELAKLLGWEFADLDDVVRVAEGLPVPEIFRQRGEAHFRAAEVRALGGLLQRNRQVIALGGGAPETPALRELLLRDSGTWVVHLQAPAELLFARCQAQAADPKATVRPLLGTAEEASFRWARRRPFYEAIAGQVVDVSHAAPADIAREIASRAGLQV